MKKVKDFDSFAKSIIGKPQDERLFTQLYNHLYLTYGSQVRYRTIRQLGSDESVSVITNMILRIQKSGHKWDSDKCNFHSWCGTLMRNEISMFISKHFNDRKRTVLFSPTPSDSPDSIDYSILRDLTSDVYTSQKYDELINMVVSKIGDETVEYRKGILLSYFVDELTYAEIQYKYNLSSISTVKNAIFKFRKINHDYFKRVQTAMEISY
jgi:hypothetical protein